jgi:LacI family transcriptional regulator
MIALGALLAVRDAGLRCPKDISIMGFDDLDLAEVTNPPLASVSQSGYQLGTTAARVLLDRIKLGAGPAQHVILKTSLKLRQSVAAPAQENGQKLESRATRKLVRG